MIQTKKIKQLPIEIIDGDRSHRYPKRSEFQETGVLFLNTANIVQNRLDLTEANFISLEKFNEIRKGRLQQFDIVITTRGSIGKVALFNLTPPTGIINAQMLILRADSKVIDPKFLFYQLCDNSFQTKLKNFASGAAQPQIPIMDLKEIEIKVPPLVTQRKIAAILSAYDDLIKNNTRRIKILEDMAQTLYREWFVHFRFPGHENVPMAESELGLIPQGWKVVPASEAIFVNPKTSVSRDTIKPFVPMKSATEYSMLITEIEEKTGNSGAKFKNGDTLFARITPCLENGRTGFVQFLPNDDEIAFGSTEFIVLRSRTLNPYFIYLLAQTRDFRENAIKSMTGATGRQRVLNECFDNYFLPNPNPEILCQFESTIAPLFRKVQNLSEKNTNLHQTRDLLLPKLISGEIDVSELDIDTAPKSN